MKNVIKAKMQSLTDLELKQCWSDIQEYNKEGMMGNTLVRQIRTELAEEFDSNWDIGCVIVTIPEILYEIARRHYQE